MTGLPTVREVQRLAEAGIVNVQTVGRTRVVRANWELSWAEPLARLLDLTMGPLARLSEALIELLATREAWIYGSWAERYKGKVGRPPRDVDVLAVGEAVDIIALTILTDRLSDRLTLPVHAVPVSVANWDPPAPGSFLEQVKHASLVEIPLAARA